jgi:hypothetical protein
VCYVLLADYTTLQHTALPQVIKGRVVHAPTIVTATTHDPQWFQSERLTGTRVDNVCLCICSCVCVCVCV